MDERVESALRRIAGQIGAGIFDLSFALRLEGGALTPGAERFGLSAEERPDGSVVFAGRWRDVRVRWTFTPAAGGYWVRLDAESEYALDCAAMDSLILGYRPGCDDLPEWRVPGRGGGFDREGMFRVRELAGGSDSGMVGVFRDSRSVGLFAGTRIPQRHIHRHALRRDGEAGVVLTCTTRFVEGLYRSKTLASEETWVCAGKRVGEAIEAYASHMPTLDPSPLPPVGWSSWDYYFRAVSLPDVIENMEEIRRDPVLSQRIRYVVVDDGWQVVWGEWYANHRFPGGLERMAEEIRSRGFIPGIWTAPVAVHALSKTALRSYEFLVKDEYGDPTGRFHDPSKGHYDVLRDLFALVRECVTDESHILGCSLPTECGPRYADSGRIGIDIHNQWSHVEWAVDYHQTHYWLHNRVWVNDPDFLVVRGRDTSLELETNVLNPKAHNPHPPRWRRGPVFTLDEARTWASLVLLSGGCIFLSGRLSALNEAGLSLLRRVLEAGPAGVAARPLDLCDGERPSLWLQEFEDEYRLGVINWSDQAQEKRFSFAACGLDAPREVVEFWSGTRHVVRDGVLALTLPQHASALLTWPVSF